MVPAKGGCCQSASLPGGTGTTGPEPTSAGTTDPTQGTETGDDPPPLGGDACQGYATRYWDCCKAHCGWEGNVNPATEPLMSCNKNDDSLGAVYDVMSACQSPQENSAFTCYDEAPWAVSHCICGERARSPS